MLLGTAGHFLGILNQIKLQRKVRLYKVSKKWLGQLSNERVGTAACYWFDAQNWEGAEFGCLKICNYSTPGLNSEEDPSGEKYNTWWVKWNETNGDVYHVMPCNACSPETNHCSCRLRTGTRRSALGQIKTSDAATIRATTERSRLLPEVYIRPKLQHWLCMHPKSRLGHIFDAQHPSGLKMRPMVLHPVAQGTGNDLVKVSPSKSTRSLTHPINKSAPNLINKLTLHSASCPQMSADGASSLNSTGRFVLTSQSSQAPCEKRNPMMTAVQPQWCSFSRHFKANWLRLLEHLRL